MGLNQHGFLVGVPTTPVKAGDIAMATPAKPFSRVSDRFTRTALPTFSCVLLGIYSTRLLCYECSFLCEHAQRGMAMCGVLV
jgi:hypothetical protein